MRNHTLATPLWAAVAIMLALAACRGPSTPPKTAVGPGAPPGPLQSSKVNWSLLTPFARPERPDRTTLGFVGLAGVQSGSIAADVGTLGNGYLAGGVFPYYSSGNLAETPGVYLADPAAHTVYQVTALSRDVLPIAMSRGGGLVTVNSGGQIGILDPRTQLIQVFPQLLGQAVTSADVDAYGDIVYTDQVGQVHILNPQTGQDFISPVASRGIGPVGNVSISGDGHFVSYTGPGPNGLSIYTTDLATGQQLSPPFLDAAAGGPVGSVQLSADGLSLLFMQAGQLRLLDHRTGFIDNLPLLNEGGPVFDAAFVGSGTNRIAFTRFGQLQVYDRVTHLIDTMPYANQGIALGAYGRGAFNYGRLF